jgi:hypothetical protein
MSAWTWEAAAGRWPGSQGHRRERRLRGRKRATVRGQHGETPAVHRSGGRSASDRGTPRRAGPVPPLPQRGPHKRGAPLTWRQPVRACCRPSATARTACGATLAPHRAGLGVRPYRRSARTAPHGGAGSAPPSRSQCRAPAALHPTAPGYRRPCANCWFAKRRNRPGPLPVLLRESPTTGQASSPRQDSAPSLRCPDFLTMSPDRHEMTEATDSLNRDESHGPSMIITSTHEPPLCATTEVSASIYWGARSGVICSSLAMGRGEYAVICHFAVIIAVAFAKVSRDPHGSSP